MRARVTVAAVLVVGLALVGGALILVALLGSVLTDQVCQDARDRAAQLAVAGGGSSSSTREIVQVTDRSGRLVGGGTPLASPGSQCVSVEPPGHGEDFVFAAAKASSGDEVVVGRPLVDVLDSTRFVRRVLVIGVPLMMLVVGAVTWVVTGRMLAPVTAIRREVDEISATELHRRVPATRRDEIGRLGATMNRMLDRLQTTHEAQQRFVSDAAHELRSPIATIRQHAEVAAAHPERTTSAELAETVLAEDVRMQQLVDDLLLLASSGEQPAVLPHTPVDLDDLLITEARRLRSATGLAVVTSGVSGGQVLGDESALTRMIRNLTGNAARHARSEIRLGLAEAGDTVVLTVADDGPGIPLSERDRVFDRFVRLDGARGRETGGVGLGLAIVTEIVRRHRGTVTIAGTSTLTVRLPSAAPS
ncbi:sensor histidine kinase [Kribbella sp. NPDC058693]|uniref:sensor histidine kinase n=1 Tax=Kribbella sp. NPDC058693 TaxID=3346602 RepID=UPI0036545794